MRTVFCLSALALMAGCGLDDNNSPTSAAASTSSSPPSSTVSATPTIKLSGTPPASVVAGSAYVFQPTVVTTVGTATFSASGLPGWASIDPGTGRISGTPAASDVGTTGAIAVSAVDGGTTASLPAFTIQVTAPQTASGSASLSWTAPTVNTNGTPITDLAGYHIYYGTTEGSLDTFIDVPGAALTEYEISNLASGTYFFTVTAYNSLGLESAASNQASKTI